MATVRKPISFGMPDTSGKVYPSTLAAQMTLTNNKRQPCMVMDFPAGADLSLETGFKIPKNYVSGGKVVATMILNGTPSGTLAFGAQILAGAVSETVDAAYGAEATASNAVWTGFVAKDIYEISITLTGTLAVDDWVMLNFYRDDSVDNTSFPILLVALEFEYSNA